jgi:hypothetical protein
MSHAHDPEKICHKTVAALLRVNHVFVGAKSGLIVVRMTFGLRGQAHNVFAEAFVDELCNAHGEKLTNTA